MDHYIAVSLIAVSAILSCFIGLPMFKILQLSGYKTRGAVAWWKGTSYDVMVRYAALMLFAFISMIIFIGCFGTFEYVRYCAPVLYMILAVVFVVSAGKAKSNDVKYTRRMIRMLAVNMVLSLALGALVAFASIYNIYCQTLTAALAITAPFTAILSNLMTAPFEKLNNKKYVRRAKAELDKKSPIVIGITGSFGKTTAKNMLAEMLKSKYTVIATPGNYNTPMGICKTVNDMLGDERVFIAELGARYKGDIKELCDIVKPEYGIITAIGDMHTETMGSREGVANVKFELGAALPCGGLLALNGYNPDCAALEKRDTACKKIVTGGDAIRYEALEISGRGTCFTLVIGEQKYGIESRLLGAHVAELACVCAAIASTLGVDGEHIAAAVNGMPPVAHRLELMDSPDPAVAVIDDAYNSNPVGAKNALDVLACFNGKKIIITPGFVELGGIEKECNVGLGANIAAVCDYAFLIGSRAADIKKGAIKAGMSEGVITVCASRDEAVSLLKDITGERVVLFENDLPDNIK